ncbi:MAG TPA: tripartite tricarboxylate transporter substrate binding protein [Ramlibacter sp.]|jgi:tripartite-type tricarboxylate transporter receptor subunit TctC|nr:tripartite tricarboxylate transporter substrate binding protein [Ramlibacter sp.]
MIGRRSWALHFAAVTASALLLAGHAHAQAFPNKPVRVVVPLTPGSGADIVARILGRKLQEMWGQPVLVDNRPGAGGQIGTREVVRAAPDGHTLLVQSASHAANVAMYKSLPYDPLKDLVDVALLARTPYVMVASASGPYKSVKDVVDRAKSRSPGVFFASAGVGTSTHLTAELFADKAGVQMTHVPFKGSPDAINDVAGGNSAFYMAPLPTVGGMLKDGKLVPIAVTSDRRVPALANVPTIAESGYPGFQAELWVGLWAPAGTPQAVLDKLAADVATALKSPEVVDQFARGGNEPGALTPAQFARFVRSEVDTNRELVRKANIPVE